MGGGDLNLKKSWHPSTMKNMEKVWKAEQQDHQEKKRIAELKREIEMEKDKEDMTKYAMDQGVIEKKDDKKLDWMYKGPNQIVNREDYLLGKPIDKSFEKMAQAEKDGELNRVPKNHVEYECIPPSLRFFSGSEQVDLARKLQEDPLYAIKKKEMETKSQLLKNPVRLKQLRDLLDEQSKSKSDKRGKKKKKKRSKSRSEEDEEEDSDGDLDNLLAKKYKKLKNKINEDYLLKSMKKLRKEKKKRSRGKYSDSDTESCSEESERDEKKGRLKQKKKGEERETRRKECKKKQCDRSVSNERAKSSKRNNRNKRGNSDTSSCSENEEDDDTEKRRKMKNQESQDRTGSKSNRVSNKHDNHDKSPYRKHNISARDNRPPENEGKRNLAKLEFGLMRADRTKVENVAKLENSRPSKSISKDRRQEKRWIPPKKQKLTDEEKEQRRLEMMANANWRDRERAVNVNRYREQEKKEQSDKTYNKDFIRKQLAVAAEVGTIESRIRANINNIQRSGRAMDTNFAKR